MELTYVQLKSSLVRYLDSRDRKGMDLPRGYLAENLEELELLSKINLALTSKLVLLSIYIYIYVIFTLF